jgi:hypothetical protein
MFRTSECRLMVLWNQLEIEPRNSPTDIRRICITTARPPRVESIPDGCYNLGCSTRSQRLTACSCWRSAKVILVVSHKAYSASNQAVNPKRGQVAQVVERSPEKAGVGGSTPSLATIFLLNLASVHSAFWFRLVPIDSQAQFTLSPKLLSLSTTFCCDSGTNCS